MCFSQGFFLRFSADRFFLKKRSQSPRDYLFELTLHTTTTTTTNLKNLTKNVQPEAVELKKNTLHSVTL